jgi:hypothetical protein
MSVPLPLHIRLSLALCANRMKTLALLIFLTTLNQAVALSFYDITASNEDHKSTYYLQGKKIGLEKIKKHCQQMIKIDPGSAGVRLILGEHNRLSDFTPILEAVQKLKVENVHIVLLRDLNKDGLIEVDERDEIIITVKRVLKNSSTEKEWTDPMEEAKSTRNKKQPATSEDPLRESAEQ